MIAILRERLSRKLAELADELTVRIPARLGEEEGFGEHRAIVDEQRRIYGRIHFLHQTLSALEQVEPHMLPSKGAGFGSTVRLRDASTGDESAHTLMAGHTIDLEAGEISLASPVGHALIGRKEGDEIEVATPLGRRILRIVSVKTLQDEIEGGGMLLEMDLSEQSAPV